MANKNPRTDHLKTFQFTKENPIAGPGRPKGGQNLSTILKEFLEVVIKGEDPLTGKPIEADIKYMISSKLISKALNGDDRAITEIYDRLEGKPKQKLDVSADVKVKGFLQMCTKKALEKK